VYLFFATVAISLIIEQMYIVFRKEKTLRYKLVYVFAHIRSRLKYVSEFIKTQPNINNEFRHELINYMITAQWKEITSTPKFSELTSKLEKNMFSESILSKTQDPLPLIIRSSFMPLLKSKYFPANYFLIDNVSHCSFLEQARKPLGRLYHTEREIQRGVYAGTDWQKTDQNIMCKLWI
jgi:hypothetical protein